MSAAWQRARPIVRALTPYLGFLEDVLEDILRLRAGETVLVTGTARGAGSSAVQVALLAGAHVIAAAGSEGKLARLVAHVRRPLDTSDYVTLYDIQAIDAVCMLHSDDPRIERPAWYVEFMDGKVGLDRMAVGRGDDESRLETPECLHRPQRRGSSAVEARIRRAHRLVAQWTPGSPVAVETVGNWYWLVDEIEEAGMTPRLVHARKAKLMSGMINKTDKLDVRGLNRLQRTGTLPTVWIPPAEVRDQRDLPRTRMALVRTRTRFKNRIHATLAKYALTVTDVSDLFGKQGRVLLADKLAQLPSHTRFATDHLLEQLEILDEQITGFEDRMREVFKKTPALEWVMSLPGIGFIVGIVVLLEVGDVHRFPDAEHLAAYAGTTPRVSGTGGKIRFGRLRPDINHYLKWAYVEAAEVICRHRAARPQRHVSQLYARVRHRKNHEKAIGAVARHLAEQHTES